MARFYGTLQGNRGRASRLGTPASGIKADVNGWNIGAVAEVHNFNGVDVVEVAITGGSNGGVEIDLGTYKLVDGKPVKVA